MARLDTDAPESVAGVASRARAKASQLGQKASAVVDDNRETAAEKLASAASALHDKADAMPGGEKVAGAAHRTADALGSAADYVADTDFKGMLTDLQQVVKNHPGPALLGAAALGFLIARTFRRE